MPETTKTRTCRYYLPMRRRQLTFMFKALDAAEVPFSWDDAGELLVRGEPNMVARLIDSILVDIDREFGGRA